ncbi:hypothetical protein ACFSFY_11165 [Sporosarcina siberiensis]|uniref:YqxM protein n=1 Tax=Sporosarcina siberiensis TaxID=1365606 RepID=A0ABW4SJJ0_9BACL
MRGKRRRRYKKNNRIIIFNLKIALICYTTIFGVSFMSNETSAFLSSQTEISQGITAGVWVVPELDECGEIIETEEGLIINEENLILGEENIGICEGNEENSNDLIIIIDEAICENEDGAILSETDLIDCINLETDPKVDEVEIEFEDEDKEGQVIEGEEIEIEIEKEDEPINENDGLEKEKERDKNESTEKLQEKPKDKEEPIIEQIDKSPEVVDESAITNSDEETDN